MTALATVCLLLTVVPVSEMALPALAGVMLIPVVVELERRYALTAYGTVSLLALFLVPSWEPKLLFIGFFGYYPVIKALIERRCRRATEWVLKLALFNVAAVLVYGALFAFFSLDPAEFAIGGRTMLWLWLLLGNAVFALYDIGLTQAISRYTVAVGPRLRKLFRF